MPHSDKHEVVESFTQAVLIRAKWSGSNVDKIAPLLEEAICGIRDPHKFTKMRMKEGLMDIALWVYLRGSRYVFAYEHSSGVIEMREKFLCGAVLHAFSNVTTPERLKSIFASL